jgi:hypothetical protein
MVTAFSKPVKDVKPEVTEINWASEFPIKSGEWRKVNKLFECKSGTYYRINFYSEDAVSRSFFVMVIGNQVVDLTEKANKVFSIWGA